MYRERLGHSSYFCCRRSRSGLFKRFDRSNDASAAVRVHRVRFIVNLAQSVRQPGSHRMTEADASVATAIFTLRLRGHGAALFVYGDVVNVSGAVVMGVVSAKRRVVESVDRHRYESRLRLQKNEVRCGKKRQRSCKRVHMVKRRRRRRSGVVCRISGGVWQGGLKTVRSGRFPRGGNQWVEYALKKRDLVTKSAVLYQDQTGYRLQVMGFDGKYQ